MTDLGDADDAQDQPAAGVGPGDVGDQGHGSASWCGYTVLADWWRAWAVRSRQEPVPVLMMWASKVSRPAMAAQSRGPVKVAVRSEKADSPGR